MKNALPRDTGSGPPGHNYVNCTSFYITSSSNRLTRMNDSLPLNLFYEQHRGWWRLLRQLPVLRTGKINFQIVCGCGFVFIVSF